ARGNPARGLEARHPAHRAGDAHPETLGRRIARHAAVHHCPHNALAKIVGKRHPRRLLRAAKIMNQNSSDSGIPQRFTSLGYRSRVAGALAHSGPTLVPVSNDRPRFGQEVLTRPSVHKFAGALQTMGFDEAKALEHARTCGQSIVILSRILNPSLAAPPGWAASGGSIVPALLAGAWDSSNQIDTEIVSMLAGGEALCGNRNWSSSAPPQ